MSETHEFEREVELIDYIEVVLKKKWLIARLTGACMLLVGINSLMGTRQYHAESLVVVSQAISTISNSEPDETSPPEIIVPKLAAQTYQALAKADELVADLLDSLLKSDLSQDAIDYLQVATIDDIASEMLEAKIVAATEKAESPLLSFRVKSVSGEIAVPMVNLWVELFVERHRGLSSNVADDYYHRVLEQHATAKLNFDGADRELRILQSSHSRLTVLTLDRSIRSARLSETLQRQQELDVSLDDKREELAFLNRTIAQVEWQQNWIGFIQPEMLAQIESQDNDSETRRELIALRRAFDSALADSLRIAPMHDAQRNTMASRGQQRLFEFERRSQSQQLRAQERQLAAAIDSFRSDLSHLEIELAGIELESQVMKKNLSEEPPTLTVAKAIVDDELWTQVAERGRIESSLQEKLGSYRLVSELVNPTHQELDRRARDAQVLADITKSRIEHLRVEIPLLEERLAQTRLVLADFSKEEDALRHELTRESTELAVRLAREAQPIADRLSGARATMKSSKRDYKRAKEQQLHLRQETSKLSANLDHEKRNIQRLGAQLTSRTAEVDSLIVLRDRLLSEHDIYKQSTDRLSRLLEESRIAREQATGDIQVVSGAVIARPVPRGTVKKVSIAGIVGLMASTMLAFLLEYTARTREQKQNTTPTA